MGVYISDHQIHANFAFLIVKNFFGYFYAFTFIIIETWPNYMIPIMILNIVNLSEKSMRFSKKQT